jgi:hypothetical protein
MSHRQGAIIDKVLDKQRLQEEIAVAVPPISADVLQPSLKHKETKQ